MTPVLALPPPVPGVRRDLLTRSGRVTLWEAGQGPVLLLVHSINAAASAYEVRPLFECMQTDHRVVAVELPGFGSSERGDRAYQIAVYCEALDDVIAVLSKEAGAPIHALAVSLSSEFLARVARAHPERLRSLTLVTPTGFDRRSDRRRGPEAASREVPWLHRILSNPRWSQGLFNLLTRRASIAYFLGRTFGTRAVPEALTDYCWLSARQPGARHAPLSFLSGRLFSADSRLVYEALSMPVWVPHATRGDFRDFSGAEWARARPQWRFQAFEAGALPYFEHPGLFEEALRGFLSATEASGRVSV